MKMADDATLIRYLFYETISLYNRRNNYTCTGGTAMNIEYQKISVKAVTVRSLQHLKSSIIFIVIAATICYLSIHFHWWSWIKYVSIVAIILDLLSIPWTFFVSSPIFYKTFGYQITDDFLYIKSGIWTVSEEVVPMTKIQSINISQNLVMRRFGVSSVTLTTMGGSHEISYIDRQVAEKMRDDISVLARLKELDEK